MSTHDWTGATTKRLTAAEQAWRNKRIADAHGIGLSWTEIADIEGISKATARRAAREHQESVSRLGSALPPVGLPESARASLWLRPEARVGADPDTVAFAEALRREREPVVVSAPEVGGVPS